MVRFGGNDFVHCSIPLIFCGRYFILESGTLDTLISVVIEYQGKPVFEVLKNQPMNNPLSETSKTPLGIVTICDKETGRFLYEIRPGPETSIVLNSLTNNEIIVVIYDQYIHVDNTKKIIRNSFFGRSSIVIDEKGGIGIREGFIPSLFASAVK